VTGQSAGTTGEQNRDVVVSKFFAPDDEPAIPFTRTEVIEAAERTATTKYDDGTVRVDQKLPDAPPPEPVTVKTEYRYTKEDMDRLHHSEGRMRIQVGGPVHVEESAPYSNNNRPGNWLSQSQR
jgi:hypothetical protein